MKVKYLASESKLYDLMQFPRLMFVEQSTTSKGDYGYTALDLERLNDPTYIDMIHRAKKQLAPYEEALTPFYANEFMSDYDLFSLLTKVFPIIGYGNIADYLDGIVAEDEATIKKQFITSLVLTNNEADVDGYSESAKTAEALLQDKTKLLNFMKELPTEATYKWHLMMLFEDLPKAIRTYKDVMQQVESVYEGFYAESAALVREVIERIVEPINKEGVNAFEAMTHHLIDSKLFSNEENIMFISYVFPYSFMVRTDVKGKYMVWGVHMEEGFKKVSEEYQNELEKRTQLFKSLGDKTRYEVLKLIASGVSTTKAIAERLNVSSATVSYHINAFVTSRVITLSRVKGRKYEVDFDRLRSVFEACLEDLGIQNTTKD